MPILRILLPTNSHYLILPLKYFFYRIHLLLHLNFFELLPILYLFQHILVRILNNDHWLSRVELMLNNVFVVPLLCLFLLHGCIILLFTATCSTALYYLWGLLAAHINLAPDNFGSLWIPIGFSFFQELCVFAALLVLWDALDFVWNDGAERLLKLVVQLLQPLILYHSIE